MQQNFLKGLGYFLLTMFVYSAMDSLAKSLLVNISIVQIGWTRFAIHSVLLFGILTIRNEARFVLTPAQPKLQVLRSLFLLGVMVNMYFALKSVSLANVSALVSVAPFVVAIGASVFLKEKVKTSGWIAIVSGFIGAMIIIRPGSGMVQWTAIFALLAAFCFAGQQLVSRLIASSNEKDWVTLFYTAAIALATLSLFIPFYWEPLSTKDFLAVTVIGVLAAIGDTCLLKSFGHTSASSLAPYGFSIIVFGGLLGWIFFGEIPDFFGAVGTIIIIISGVVLLMYKNKEGKLVSEVDNPGTDDSFTISDKKIFTETNHPALHYERMIGDQPRMDQYRRAINQSVKRGDVVADLGTGLGILAMMAAQAGAKKVYAIDMNPNSIWMAKQIAQQNGVSEIIEFIVSDAQKLKLDNKVDVIVNELIGEFGCEEGVIETVTAFAKNNLKENGTIVPNKIKTYLVPIEYKNSFRQGWTADNAGIDLTLPMQFTIKQEPVKYYLEGRQNDLSQPQFVENHDFNQRPFSKRPEQLELQFTVNKKAIFHGFVGYFDLKISDNVRLANYPRYTGCHWENWNWPISPHIAVNKGDIINVKMTRAYESGTENFIKKNKDTTSGWEPKYDWRIDWNIL